MVAQNGFDHGHLVGSNKSRSQATESAPNQGLQLGFRSSGTARVQAPGFSAMGLRATLKTSPIQECPCVCCSGHVGQVQGGSPPILGTRSPPILTPAEKKTTIWGSRKLLKPEVPSETQRNGLLKRMAPKQRQKHHFSENATRLLIHHFQLDPPRTTLKTRYRPTILGETTSFFGSRVQAVVFMFFGSAP